MSRNAVFFTADRNYFPIAWTAARTAAAQPDRNFDVLILTEAPALQAAPPGCRIIQVEILQALAGWPCVPHSSAISYGRLAAPELWLAGYERAVYIDSDTSIHGSLNPLFTLDLRGAMVAMVEDCGRYLRDAAGQRSLDDCRRQLGINPAIYFNSGTIVMDLERMRAARLWQRAQAFVDRHRDRLVFMDQDVLNALAAGEIAELSPRWNFMTHYFGLGLEAELRPVIRHYVDVVKPWRDPEWRTLHGMEAPRHFARLFRDSPWRAFMPRGLYGRCRLPWENKTAIRLAKSTRHLTAEYMAGHLGKYLGLATQLRDPVRRGLAEAAAMGRYVDASHGLPSPVANMT